MNTQWGAYGYHIILYCTIHPSISHYFHKLQTKNKKQESNKKYDEMERFEN